MHHHTGTLARPLARAPRFVLAMSLSLVCGGAGAANIVVDSFDDQSANPATCTLREAIRAANTDAVVGGCTAGNGSDRIVLSAGIYELDLAGGTNEDAALDGDLDVATPLTIEGVAPGYTVVRAATAATERVFHILNNGIDVTLRGFTVSGGRSDDIAGGGNLYNETAGTMDGTALLLEQVEIRDGIAGIAGGGIANSGRLHLREADVHDNETPPGGSGGGIHNAGTLLVEDSLIRDNTAGSGGGLHDAGQLTIYRAQVSGNTALGAQGGGGLLAASATAFDIQFTLVAGNDAPQGGGLSVTGDGGGTFAQGALAGNTAAGEGGGAYHTGNANLFLRRVTLSGNQATTGGGSFSDTAQQTLFDRASLVDNAGGGAHNERGVIFERSLLAANAGGNCTGNGVGIGPNNLDDTDACGFSANADSLFDTDPLLGALGDNLGPTPTHALDPASPAIDAVDDLTGCGNVFDQRGAPGGVDGNGDGVARCDIGAYELNAPYRVTTTLDATDADDADGLCDTGNGECSLRAAIQQANAVPGLQEIDLPAGDYRLELTGSDENAAASGDLDILDAVLVRGESAAASRIDGIAADRVFHVIGDAKAQPRPEPQTTLFRSLDVRNGTADQASGGAGILALRPVRLDGVSISDNIATAAADGGGIACRDRCRLEVFDSTFSGNRTESNGGGIYQVSSGHARIERSTLTANSAGIGGAIEATSLLLRNTTLSGNEAGSSAGFFASRALVLSSTIADNRVSGDTGGLYVLQPSVVHNSIVAANTVQGVADNCSFNPGGLVSGGHNIGDTAPGDCALSGDGDQPSTDPLLGPLQDNGGATATRAPLAGSPAIDRGDAADCPATDQRGYARPADGNLDGTVRCDTGAVETGAAPAPQPGPGPGGAAGGGSGGDGGGSSANAIGPLLLCLAALVLVRRRWAVPGFSRPGPAGRHSGAR